MKAKPPTSNAAKAAKGWVSRPDPSGTRTRATAPSSTPPPKAITKWRNSSSSHRGQMPSMRASAAPSAMHAPARKVHSNMREKESIIALAAFQTVPIRETTAAPAGNWRPLRAFFASRHVRGKTQGEIGHHQFERARQPSCRWRGRRYRIRKYRRPGRCHPCC